MNWQLQGSLHITLKSFEKAVCINTHLILDLNMTLILFWIGFTTTTPPLTMSIQILFFLLLLIYLQAANSNRSTTCTPVSLKMMENSKAFLTSETLLYIEILNAKMPVPLSLLSFTILTSDPLIYFLCR